MIKLLIGLLVLVSLSFSLPDPQSSKCRSVTAEDTTRWGGNEWVAYKQEGAYKSIGGSVELPGVPRSWLEDILVEVFDKPDYLLCKFELNNPNNCTIRPPEVQRRIAACKTGKGGRFYFKNIPAGAYELRISKDGQWSPTHVYLVVNQKGTNKPLNVRLNLGF